MNTERLALFNSAIRACEQLQERFPRDNAIRSVLVQLQFLLSLEQGVTSDWKRLDDIIIGVLTVREIEPLDEATAAILYRVVEEVEAMKAVEREIRKQQGE